MLNLKNRDHFRFNYLLPALEKGYIEPIYPDKPNHPAQKYTLTTVGEKLINKTKL